MKKSGRFAAPAGTQDLRPPTSPAAPPLGLVSSSPEAWAGWCTSLGRFRETGQGGPAEQPHWKDSFQLEQAEGGRKPACRPSRGLPGAPVLSTPTPSSATRATPPSPAQLTGRSPRPHLGSASGSPALTPQSLNGGGERKRPQGEEEGPEPSTASDAKGMGGQQPWLNCLLPLPPCRPEKPGAAVLRRSQAETRTWDGGSVGESQRTSQPATPSSARPAWAGSAAPLHPSMGFGPAQPPPAGLHPVTTSLWAAASKLGTYAELRDTGLAPSL